MEALLQPPLMELLLGNKEISLICYCLGMVFSSTVLPLKPCAARSLLPLQCRVLERGTGGTKGKDHGLR